MIKLILTSGAIFVAYQIGQKTAQIAQIDYFVTRQITPTNGISMSEYITVNNQGEFNFTQDENLATPFGFFEASTVKKLIRRFAPGSNLALQSINGLQTA